MYIIRLNILFASFVLSIVVFSEGHLSLTSCDKNVQVANYSGYFSSMRNIYKENEKSTCISHHRACGWPAESTNLPLYVIILGLEGSGHHYWTKLLSKPIFDCIWTNARHYHRDIGDGVPRRNPSDLEEGLREQLRLRVREFGSSCRKIVDTEDSFPTGALRKYGRVFMHPDIINIQNLHGKLFNVKYILSVRNSTDTILSAMRRNFVPSFDHAIRIGENIMIYIETVLKIVPCHQLFIAHYEHILKRPVDYFNPLSDFLQLDLKNRQILKKRLIGGASQEVSTKVHDLTQYPECAQKYLNIQTCYKKMYAEINDFLVARAFMWPTFSGNGFDYNTYIK